MIAHNGEIKDDPRQSEFYARPRAQAPSTACGRPLRRPSARSCSPAMSDSASFDSVTSNA